MSNVTANEKYFLHVRLEHQGHTDINIYYLQEHNYNVPAFSKFQYFADLEGYYFDLGVESSYQTRQIRIKQT